MRWSTGRSQAGNRLNGQQRAIDVGELEISSDRRDADLHINLVFGMVFLSYNLFGSKAQVRLYEPNTQYILR